MTTKDWAEYYASNGWVPIPVRHRSKEPLENSWNKTTLEVALKTMDSRFPDSEPRNIGVLLGPASAGLTDIDLDCREAREIAAVFLPETKTFGRQSAPKSHYLYMCDGIPSYKFTDPLAKDGAKGVLLEIRAGSKKGTTAFQTVMPPSVHVSGENIEFSPGDTDTLMPTPIEVIDLQRHVHLLASAVLLGRYWPAQGTRHDIAKAAAGMLAHGGCTADEAVAVIVSAAALGLDDDLDDRERCVRDTFDKYENGEEVTGAPTLESLGISPEIVKKVRAWSCTKLQVDPTSAKLFQNGGMFGGAGGGTDGGTGSATGSGGGTGGVPPVHPLTDAANGIRFAMQHASSAKYVVEWKKWIVWTGTHWSQDQIRALQLAEQTARSIFSESLKAPDKETAKALRGWARASLSNTALFNMLRAAERQPGMFVHTHELDKNVDLIACPNGTVNVRTMQLTESDPADMITRLCPTNFNPNATAPLWEKTVLEVMGGDQELAQFFQIAMGYMLTGSVREQGLFICYGVGANGKTTLLGTAQNVLGDDHCCSVPSEVLLLKQGQQNHPTGLTLMHGKRLALSVEPEMNRTLAEGLVKSLTGGDKITARRMGEDFWEYTPTHTIFFCTNHKPSIRGTDNGIWRRIWPIPFNVIFSNPDKTLTERLKAEYEGILNWMVIGAASYYEFPELFKLPTACQEFKDAYRSEEDRLASFLEDCVVVDRGSHEHQAKIWTVYNNWCQEQQEEPVGKHNFGKMMEERGFPQDRAQGKRVRRNLKLVGPIAEQYDRKNNTQQVITKKAAN